MQNNQTGAGKLMNRLVSVIMPSYNTGKFISKSIESVLAQSYKDFELIIVDDCSTDNTYEVLQKYLHDERIRFLQNEKNCGSAVSRNRAIREAKGRWIAFLDSDDLWLPDKLEKQISFMEERQIAFSYTQYSEIDEDSRPTGRLLTGPKEISALGMLNFCWPGCLTVIYDATVIGLIQIEDIKVNNDYALWLKVSRKAHCCLLNENLARYRRRRGSVSNHSYIKLIKWHYLLYRTAEHDTIFASVFNTMRNVFFGVIKKIIYVKGEAV